MAMERMEQGPRKLSDEEQVFRILTYFRRLDDTKQRRVMRRLAELTALPPAPRPLPGSPVRTPRGAQASDDTDRPV